MRPFFIFFLFLYSLGLQAQSILDNRIPLVKQVIPLVDMLGEIEKTHSVRFFYLKDWMEGFTVDPGYSGQPLRFVLDEIFLGSDLNYIEMNLHAIVIVKDPTLAIQRINTINTAIRERKKIEKVEVGSPQGVRKSGKVQLKGIVKDSKNDEPLAGVSVQVSDLQLGVTTDVTGRFSISIQPGEHVLTINYINYDERLIDLRIYQDGELTLQLEEAPRMLEEIVVMDRAAREVTTSRIGQTQLTLKEIKRQPALLGEVDLIKQIQIQPGVTTAGEAASGFNVRGGGVDQNLVLYDGMPVFNSSHVFGFFSAFNAEAIREVNFYRGGIPAEYGGRVSSVLDITSREGDYEKWTGNGGFGLISSNFLLSGPLQKNKSSVAVSLRSTYSDWLINTVRSNYINLKESSVSFYDGAAKISHKISDRSKLTLSSYSSHDQFKLQGDSTYQWDNRLGSIRLDQVFTPNLNATFLLGTGSYSYEVTDRDTRSGFNLFYKITYPSFKADFNYQPGEHKITFGVQSTYYRFNPGTLEPIASTSNVKPLEMERQHSLESALFFSEGISVLEKYYLEGGIRLSMFTSFGPATINIYQPGEPKTSATQIDLIQYSSGKVEKTYTGAEPRLSLRYQMNSTSSIKVGFNRIYQYLHLVSNTTAITPVDIWQPSNTYFKPQVADQISIGYFKNLKDKMFDAFMEVYYKRIGNILDFKDGADLILNKYIERDFLQGKGEAYGIETSLSKNSGRLTGSVNYTYSRSLRTIDSSFAEEQINNGKTYPSNFDQPHIVNLVWKYNISRRYFFTGNFTYHSGRPVTTPLSGFLIDNIKMASFSERNQFRIADYHRLDIAFVLEGSHKRKKFWDGTWMLSFYNLYARKNPYTVFFRDDGNGYLRPYQLSIIGTVLPSLSYSFKF